MGPKIYTETDHRIKSGDVDKDALEVIFRLKSAGHTAYLVGGGVRDLLLQKQPKDFDISTSARPEQIRELFGRRCLLIGQRFRLAHVRMGNKVLEVSTFRAGDASSSSLILSDNRWGTPEEDVLRRDFTINALFYDPTTHTVLDYVGGYDDIHHRLLRSIGDPSARFKQDPVRMIRLLKFRARFGFEVEQKCERALHSCQEEILKSAPARVLEEVFKMLESGYAANFFTLMSQSCFLEILFPCFHHFFCGPSKEIAFGYLDIIDKMQQESGKTLDRAELLAALVFPILEQELIALSEDRQMALNFGDIMHLTNSLLRGITTSSFAHFPKKIVAITHNILTAQYRLTPLSGRPRFHARFSSQHDFRLALNFLNIRSQLNPDLQELYLGWKKAHHQ
ncbi:MAG: polynucleotide adenylyltransferase PcnB [Verrucomicrobia bacterium]|nr:polynucleotide adenylyltransferase PcnB [Verrucomicrobiota bacterium]MBS0636660.1 polynucleotide adenylyltransferase PcnB [Verrucomicrobiota bacterium]